MKKNLKKFWPEILFLLIFFLGSFLRFYNLNWDQGHFFHPDERNIDVAVPRIRFFNQLNPEIFIYGGFLTYLYRLLGEILVFMTGNNAWVSDWGKINIVGRFCSALFATLTIPLVFALAEKVFNKKIAYLSAILATFTVSLIQAAHFSTTESLLVLSAVLFCLLSLKTFNKPSLKNYIFAGVILGIAVATKTTALSLVLFMITAQILILFKEKGKFFQKNLFFTIFSFTSFIIFTIFSPYTLLSWNKFMESMRYESGVATGSLPVIYTLQFDKTIPYFFQIKNFFWQMGPAALLGLIGFIFLLFQLIKTREKKLLYLISFPLLYFLYVGSWYTKFLRYQTPLLPFLAIFASYFLLAIQKRFQKTGNLLIIFFLLTSFLWSLAFFSIYTREQTRITASKWIYQNIPMASKILGEHWDDGLPLVLNEANPSLYHIEQLTIYDADNQDKINYYAEKLAKADYLVLNSRRLYGTLINLPEKYPVTSHYYQLLFSGQLGYTKIAEFTSYPSILGMEINDDASEETFQVYDHPKVLIFRNQKKFSKTELLNLLKR